MTPPFPDAPTPWYSQRDISSTLVKGMQVLAAFDDSRSRLSLPEIGRITGYDRATVRRLIITLVDLGYVRKTDKSFALTPKIVGLSGNYLRSHGVGATVQPVLNTYSEDIGAEVSLATISDGAALYLARSNRIGATVSFGFTIGSKLPLLQTAIGRMLLACAPAGTRDPLIENCPVIPYTADSVLDRQAIHADILKAARLGFSHVSNEFEAGITGLAVPVGRPGIATSVLGISSPTADLEPEQSFAACLSKLQMCATALDRVWPDGP